MLPHRSAAARDCTHSCRLPRSPAASDVVGFFSQFGKLTRCRVSRSKKTGKAKHYAFLEFQYPEVAKIAAATMDGYFMFVQRIVAKVLRPSQVHPALFKGANRKFKQIPWRRIEMNRQDKERMPEEVATRQARLLRKDQQRRKKIAAAGIDYEYEGLEAALPPKAKKLKFKD